MKNKPQQPEPPEVLGAKVLAREKTRKKILAALKKLTESEEKLTITAVAKAADVNPSLIHNSYPDIAEEIRAKCGKALRQQRDKHQTDLIRERESNRQLREEISQLRTLNAKIASNNQALIMEVSLLTNKPPQNVIAMRRPPSNIS